MIKIGDTAFVKSTGEEVFVLGFDTRGIPEEIATNHALSGTTAFIRRPLGGQNGLTYVTTFLLIEELETIEDRIRREKNVQDIIRKIAKEAEASEAQGTLDFAN